MGIEWGYVERNIKFKKKKAFCFKKLKLQNMCYFLPSFFPSLVLGRLRDKNVITRNETRNA